MTDPYAAGDSLAPLNPPSQRPPLGNQPPNLRPAFDVDRHYPNQQAAEFEPEDPAPLDADTVEGWAAQLLGFANWMRRNHLP